jgi:hypothetical protein
MLINAAAAATAPHQDWCFTVKHAADVYRVTIHSALDHSPYQEWYGTFPSANDLPIWGCRVLVPAHGLKKSDDRALEGQLYSFSKSHSLLRLFEPIMETVKDAHGACFIDLDPT